MRRNTLSIFALGASLATSVASADTTGQFNPDKDNILCESSTGVLSNAEGDIFVGGTSQTGPRRRGVIHFDVASAGIPAGSTITAVEMRLYLVKTGDSTARTISLHPATASWGEGTSYFNGGVCDASTTNDATWLHRFSTSLSWASAGGDYGASSGSQSVGTTFNTWHSWNTAGMVTDVQNWLATPSSNHGWVLVGSAESTSQTARRFTSRESLDDAGNHYPTLEITYTPPPSFAAKPTPVRTTAYIGGLRVLGHKDVDGDGVIDLLLRDEKRNLLLGGRQTRSGLQTWTIEVDRASKDPLAIP